MLVASKQPMLASWSSAIIGLPSEPLLALQIYKLFTFFSFQVSIVFHSAATVKFDEKLKLSVTINMLGTQQLVQLCHRMLKLEVTCGVSFERLT